MKEFVGITIFLALLDSFYMKTGSAMNTYAFTIFGVYAFFTICRFLSDKIIERNLKAHSRYGLHTTDNHYDESPIRPFDDIHDPLRAYLPENIYHSDEAINIFK